MGYKRVTNLFEWLMKNFKRVAKPFEWLMENFEWVAKPLVWLMKNFERISEPFERLTCLVACKFIDLRQDAAINNKRDDVSRNFFRGKV